MISFESIFYFQKGLYMSEITRPYKYFYDFYSMFLTRKEDINAERKSSVESLTKEPEAPLFVDKSYELPNKIEEAKQKELEEESKKEETSIFSSIFPSKQEPKKEPKEETSIFSSILPLNKEVKDESKKEQKEEQKKHLEENDSIFTFLSNSIFSKRDSNPEDSIEQSQQQSYSRETEEVLSIPKNTIKFYDNRRKNEYRNTK